MLRWYVGHPSRGDGNKNIINTRPRYQDTSNGTTAKQKTSYGQTIVGSEYYGTQTRHNPRKLKINTDNLCFI